MNRMEEEKEKFDGEDVELSEEEEVEDFLFVLDNGDLIGTETLVVYMAKKLTGGTVERSGPHSYAINGGGASPSDFVNRVPPHSVDRIAELAQELDSDEEGTHPDLWRWGPIGRKLLYL